MNAGGNNFVPCFHNKKEFHVGALNIVYKKLFKLSKVFSRKNMYEWLDHEIALLNHQFQGDDASRVLSVGAGGEIFEHLQGLKNCELVQLDINEGRDPDVVGDVCDLHMFEDNGFSAIFVMEVLEHVNKPWVAVTELHRVLKPGAKLVISTPFIVPIHEAPYDFYRFTRHGLEFLLSEFENVEVRERNSYPESILTLIARSIATKDGRDNKIGAVVFIYFLVQYPVFWLFSKLQKNPRATTGYFTTAYKPKTG